MQLALLEENKKQNMKKICNLRETVEEKELEIQALSQQIAAKECEGKDQTLMELADMKMNVIQLQNEVDRLRTAAKLSQEEATYYQECTSALLTSIPSIPAKVEMCNFVLSCTHVH